MMPEKIAMTPMPFLNGGTHTTGSGLNFRAEPIAKRLANNPDASKIFSSLVHGDPSTPLLRAYLGDTVVFRLLHTLMNESMDWVLRVCRSQSILSFIRVCRSRKTTVSPRYALSNGVEGSPYH